MVKTQLNDDSDSNACNRQKEKFFEPQILHYRAMIFLA
jgi:hypothetical protein